MGEEEMHYKSRKLLLIAQTEILHLDSVLQVICKTEAELGIKFFLWNPFFNNLINQLMKDLDTDCLKISTQTQEIPKNVFPELLRLKSFHFIDR